MTRGDPEPSQQGGRIQSRGTHGSAGAYLSQEARSVAIGHVAALGSVSAGRRGLKP
jgi:hypothetical protein